MTKSATALYVSFPNGQPYAKAAYDSEQEAFDAMAALCGQTLTFPVACRMHQLDVPYSEKIAPMWEFDLYLTREGHPDTMVLHAAIRMESVHPTLKPGDHHDTHQPHPPE